MSRVIAQRELRNDSARILRDVEAGDTFVVTRNGQPIAELRPLSRRRRLVPRDEIRALFSTAEHIEFARFRRDVDAPIDQGVE